MNKILISFVLLLMGNFCFPQQNLKIIGRIPPPDSTTSYRIQLGSFRTPGNAEAAFIRLKNAGFNPVYENYRNFTRVLLAGIKGWNMSLILKNIELLGFKEAWITEDRNAAPSSGLLVDPDQYIYGPNAGPSARQTPEPQGENWGAGSFEEPVLPAGAPDMGPSKNVIYDPTSYRVEIGESKKIRLETMLNNLGMVWSSQDPDIAEVDDTGKITGIATGSTIIEADFAEVVVGISVAVVPASFIQHVPKDQETPVIVDEYTLTTPGTIGLTEYMTEPTARLAYRFVNPGDDRGASGRNGGIDVLGRGKDDRWMWTTYYQGGFFYDLNGVQHLMANGIQRGTNGVELTVEPSFVYIDGVSYLQLNHKLKNTGRVTAFNQRFGAGADIMIHTNDHAPVVMDDYGLRMADANDEAISNLNLLFVGKTGEEDAIPVSTLWIGRWERGGYLKHIYDNGVDEHYYDGADSAMTFSFQNITLLPGESKDFVVRFTLTQNSLDF
ncbi:MAG: SPOR domain-containing protein [Spirochaetaceae bacterium]|jgi:hypothetical protein|nr:SPOR domain-containing protein [Spirochaetaceae bacterium]